MKYLFLLALSISILIATHQAGAQSSCTPVYGGGVQDDGNPFCMETVQAAAPAVAPTQQSGFTTPNSGMTQPTTKGGYAVQNPSTAKSMPSTGPEMFGLFALIPAGIAGWALRRKTSI